MSPKAMAFGGHFYSPEKVRYHLNTTTNSKIGL